MPGQAIKIEKHHKHGADENLHPLQFIANQELKHGTRADSTITLTDLSKWLASHAGLDYVRIDPLKIDFTTVTKMVSQAYAANYKILPLSANASELTVAVCEPFVESWKRDLSRITRRAIKTVCTSPSDIERYLVEFYGVSRSIFGAALEKSKDPISKIGNFEQLLKVGKVGEIDANNQHVVSVVDWLLQFAFEQRASDIHIEPRREVGSVRFRIDGSLQKVHAFPMAIMNAITSRLKILGRMDIAEKRRPQDGRIKTLSPKGKEVEMRLSTMPTAFGEKLVLRIFDPEMLYKNFVDLGFSKNEQELWGGLIQKPHGLILVTGPTGSGKTTTLYSSLRLIAKPELNVCTVEDPIEMIDDALNQMQVQQNITVDFEIGVKTLLRQDPDVIMVGEIRDRGTVNMTIQAALTGHLVLSSLHTNDAISAITRLIDLGAQPFLIGATLLGVLSQRLVRMLCPDCKEQETTNEKMWNTLTKPFKLKPPDNMFRPVGCDECRQTGFQGRIGIYEILLINTAIKKLFSASCDPGAIQKQAFADGMRPMRISGAQKVYFGLTTMDEVFSVAPSHEEATKN